MKEYIEREAAENAIRNNLPLSTWMKRSVDKAAHAMGVTVEAINAIPAADVVEVVRCRDCRYRDPEDHKCDCGELERQGCPFPVDDDYFCKCGERKGGDE